MKTWAVTNQKGGSGKTTSAVNLAAAAGELGRRVLVVDLDPQASASAWAGHAGRRTGPPRRSHRRGRLWRTSWVETPAAGVDLIPSSAWLANVDRALAGEVGAELAFRDAVKALPERWDLVLVDCPPALGLLTVSALAAVREVVVPVETSAMALAGLAALLRTVERVRDRLNPGLAVRAVLPCRVDARTNLARDVVAHLRERFGSLVTETTIRESVRVREAWSFGQPVTTYDPRGAGAEDYRAAARELLDLTEAADVPPVEVILDPI